MDIERVTTETAMTGTKMNDLSKPGTSFFLIYPTYCYLDVALVDLRGVLLCRSVFIWNMPSFAGRETDVVSLQDTITLYLYTSIYVCIHGHIVLE